MLATLIGLLRGGEDCDREYRRVIKLGRRSERWINLFGALRNAPPDLEHPAPFPDADMDEIVGKIEDFVVDEEKRGGMTAQARERLERALAAMNKKNRG